MSVITSVWHNVSKYVSCIINKSGIVWTNHKPNRTMRLVALVGCCLVLVQGSSSLPGCGRQKEEKLQRKLSDVLLKKQLRNDYQRGYASPTQAPVTDVNIQNIHHDSDTNIVESKNNIGKINNNLVNTKSNTNQISNNYINNDLAAYGGDETKTVSNNCYGEVPHSRRKREIVIKNGNTTTYKYVSQPGRSRFTYLKKVQKLPEPEPKPEPKINALAVQGNTTVKVEHMNLSEEDHEEVHEEHIHTTKHSKKSSKHKKKNSRRSKRKRSRKEKSSVIEIEDSNTISNQELINPIKTVKSTNVTETEKESKKQKSFETKVKEPNVTTIDKRNETENSFTKKRNEVSKTESSDPTGRSVVTQKELNESEDILKSEDNRTTKKKTRKPAASIAQPAAVKALKRQRYKIEDYKLPRGSAITTGDSLRRSSAKTTRRPIVMNNPRGPTRLRLDTGLRGSLDLVPLGSRDGAPNWGVPMVNAAGKVEYLSLGGGKGDIHFVPRTDNKGHTEFLYPTVDDSGLSHNIRLRTQKGRLTLVETDFQNGAKSSGFLGYDDSGEYVVPVHFEQGHHLVAEPRAHSLLYAIDVHPTYEIVNQVFH